MKANEFNANEVREDALRVIGADASLCLVDKEKILDTKIWFY